VFRKIAVWREQLNIPDVIRAAKNERLNVIRVELAFDRLAASACTPEFLFDSQRGKLGS
jgi:hypothetical protein